jgi:hypothetical protein
MKQIFHISLAISLGMVLVAIVASFCCAADFSVGSKINVSGNMVYSSGCIEWPDGLQCGVLNSSLQTDISALQAEDLRQNADIQSRELISNKGVSGGYAPLDDSGRLPINFLPLVITHPAQKIAMAVSSSDPPWLEPVLVNGVRQWVDFPDLYTPIYKLQASSRLHVHWSDNVGIYSNNWCNVQIVVFRSGSSTPQATCNGSWSGVTNTTIFNQQHLDCLLDVTSSGNFDVRVRHRSGYCMYGNHAYDDDGITRSFSIQEVQ